MITEVCAEIKNYFLKSNNDIHEGDFEISNNSIVLDFLKNGQYFRIVGSALNDGVYQYPTLKLTDESFSGAIWAMNVPPSFVALVGEIETFNKSDAAKPSAYVSESFGSYTYTKATTSTGVPTTWQKLFASRLNVYRRINVL